MSQHESADAEWQRAHRAALVIDDARERLGLTIRAAARLVPMTGEWWSANIRGDRAVGRNQRILVTAPDETLAKMARAVGVEAEVRNMLGMRPVAAGALTITVRSEWERRAVEAVLDALRSDRERRATEGERPSG